MILLDANVLIGASMAPLPEHERLREWLEERLWSPERVGLPWPSLLSFLRIVTNPRIYERPQSIPAAWAQVQDWLSAECVWIPQPTEAHPQVLAQMLASVPGGGNAVPDAHLAALAVEHGLQLVTLDAGFARFSRLNWRPPF